MGFDIAMIVAVVFLAIGMPMIGTWYERKKWNGGISPYTGEKWKHFDTDSQGGRGYTDSEENVIWISWPWVDNDE